MNMFSALQFITPMALWAALALPILWFVFKTIPPHPRLIKLPTARFLKDIETEDSQKDDIPWWLKLLRIILMACVILAAAGPYLAPKQPVKIDGDAIAIIMDNSWAAAPQVEKQRTKAASLINLAEQKGKKIVLIETIPEHKNISPIKLLIPAEARNRVKHIQIYPWEADHAALLNNFKEQESILSKAKTFYWLGHGYNDGDINALSKYLRNFGKVIYFDPDSKTRARVIKGALNKDGKDTYKYAQFDGFYYNDQRDYKLFLKDSFSNVLGFMNFDEIRNNTNEDLAPLWDALSNNDDTAPSYIQIGPYKHAASTYFLPAEILKQKVGIVSGQDTVDREISPLIQAIYYISKAVEGKAPYSIDPVDKLLDWGAKLIIVPENYVLNQSDMDKLSKWVKQGGTLLRFPPNQQDGLNAEDILLPVELLKEERSIAGRIDWQEPLSLAKIPEDSPLAGIPFDKQLEIKRQVLAVPSARDNASIWAVASDGTPIISARDEGQGRIILIHTQAKPGWSNMPLTGFFVNVLHRIIDISSGARMQTSKSSDTESMTQMGFTPYKKISAQGELIPADHTQIELSIQDLRNKPLSYDYWPGIYHSNNAEYIVNLGDKLGPLNLINARQLNADIQPYSYDRNINLRIYFIIAALVLFFIEWIVVALLSGAGQRINIIQIVRKANLFIPLFMAVSILSLPAAAADDDASRANSLNLAYVETSNPIVNAMAQKGLQYVANALTQRTALLNVRVVGVNIAKDDLAFYPLLYWPIENQTLDDESYARSNDYINTGGMLFIDIRNGRKLAQSFYSRNQPLHTLGEKLFIPLLSPLPQNHVLRKSYYLVSRDNIGGRHASGDIWLDLGGNTPKTDESTEETSQHVASLIIGSNDWIGIWSDENADIYKRENALRFAINLVMYALTGTYKQDQVHTKAILERLNQRQQQLRRK
ncbi:MAG: DUF4159 domain-containing protein [Pseudomonadota bacterium]|nr:DUF4159 domain-containing protein [Pseudomonadota bacterium]